MNPSDNAIVPLEQKQMIIRNVTGNVTLGAASGAAIGSALATVTLLSGFPIAGMIAIAGGVAAIVFLIALFFNSAQIKHARIERSLERVNHLHRQELITRGDFERMKADLLAEYKQPNRYAIAKSVHAAKLASSVWLGVGAVFLALVSGAGGTALTLSLVGAGVGAFVLLIGSMVYRLAVDEYLYGEDDDRKALTANAEHPSLDEGERAPLLG